MLEIGLCPRPRAASGDEDAPRTESGQPDEIAAVAIFLHKPLMIGLWEFQLLHRGGRGGLGHRRRGLVTFVAMCNQAEGQCSG